MRILDRLIVAIRSAAVHNPDVQAAPACILWPDGDRQWESVAPRLQNEMPELLQLGEYSPENRTGPAIWLRCAIAGSVDAASSRAVVDAASSRVDVDAASSRVHDAGKRQDAASTDHPPILYLPGVSRQDLRAVGSCPERLKPLAELQYRGAIWTQGSAKDWTILAFLKSNQGGLGLDVAQDRETKHAMQLALYAVLEEELDRLQDKHLDKDYFNTLLAGGDPIRDLLLWLDQGEAFKAARDENAWRGFVQVCKSQLGFDPDQDGSLKGAANLAERKGPWQAVWDRFCEAPQRYATLPALIDRTQPPRDLFTDRSGWPKWNREAERDLRRQLLEVAELPAHEARGQLCEAEQRHAERRDTVWAELGKAPLAHAVEHLAGLARTTGQSLAAGSPQEMAAAYQAGGWQADRAVLAALAAVGRSEDATAVTAAIRAVYLPWLDEAARHLQEQVTAGIDYPGDPAADRSPPKQTAGQCLVFVDGLRFDLGKRLERMLAEKGCAVESQIRWAALPSVTATGKPAVAPIAHLLKGDQMSVDFEPMVTETGQSLRGGYPLAKLLKEHGWQVLGRSECGDPAGRAWTETGEIDREGHERGWRLAAQLDRILDDICERVLQLLDAGWSTVRVVSDHGWLLVPGGLPKSELASALSENKWGRCAVIKPGAKTKETMVPWYWNGHQYFALAPGSRCYRAGIEYTHGGLSLQECLLRSLTVGKSGSSAATSSLTIQEVSWQGLRCKVAITGDPSGLRLDLRTHAGNPTTSVARSVRPLKQDGTASVVVADEELTGHEATIVILDQDGSLAAQVSTTIGA